MLNKGEYLRNELRGQIYKFTFDSLPTVKEIYDAIKTVDSCPFGYRILYTVRTTTTKATQAAVIVKIHND